jgi:chemotaxis family two-component system sensor kinase Cph1
MITTTSKHVPNKNCQSKPVRWITHIQNFGVLIAIEKQNHMISHVSENAEKTLSIPVDKLLGESIFSFGDHPQLKTIVELLKEGPTKPPSTEPILIDPHYELLFHEEEKHYIFEWILFEKKDKKEMIANFHRMFLLFREKKAKELDDELFQDICNELKFLMSFDKILIYRFRGDQHGDVIAEAKAEGMEAYLHLRFPASDVPPLVRDVYLSNPLRIIYNAWDSHVEIKSSENEPSLDMTQSILKGVAKIHQEYIQTMKISTSISFAITLRGKLWGLICLHHKTPKELTYQERLLLILVAQLLEMFLLSEENKKTTKLVTQVKEVLLKVVDVYTNSKKNLSDLFEEYGNTIMKFIELEGCTTYLNGKCQSQGKTPPPDFIQGLIDWLAAGNMNEGFFATDCLMEHYPHANEHQAMASGIVAFTIGSDPKEMMIWFRPNQIKNISWAGNPYKDYSDHVDTLSPRHSFSVWMEQVKDRSIPWQPHEIETAKEIQGFTRKMILELLIAKELRDLNKQKDTFLQMAAHDLRNPLSSILGAIGILKEQDLLNPKTVHLMDIIQRQGQSMVTMLNELLNTSVLESIQTQINKQATNLATFFNEIEASNKLLFEKKGIPLHMVLRLDVVQACIDANKIKQVIENLLSNALKYSPPGKSVTLTAKSCTSSLKVEVEDHGLGIPVMEHDHVFVPLSKLSPKPTGGEKSFGIGLSLCKKTIVSHGGEIGFTSSPGVGSNFFFSIDIAPPS